jgi:glycosyltransferase involved in cell wall biosynthesis
MRVLLTHKFFRLTGGAEVFFFETGKSLVNNGHEIAYFSTHHPDNITTEWNDYFIEPPAYDSKFLTERIFSLKNIIYSKNAKNAFSKLLHDFQPDIVHAFAIYTHLTPSIFEAAKEMGIPVVMSCNDYKHICPNYKLYDGTQLCEDCRGAKFYNAILKKCCKNSLAFSTASSLEAYVHNFMKVHEKYVDRFLFASQFMLDKTKSFWRDKDISYGVLKNPFKASDYNPVYSGEYALYFGRIIDEKGVDRLVEAAKLISIPIKIIGDGPDLEKLTRIARENNLSHVEFLGPMWGKDLDNVLYGARFVIVPSIWNENFPYVIFQAFAAGKPVLGSRRGGIPELIGEDRGLLFDPSNIQEMADSMTSMWEKPDECERMGLQAREYIVKEYSDEVFYNSIMSNYKAVLK